MLDFPLGYNFWYTAQVKGAPFCLPLTLTPSDLYCETKKKKSKGFLPSKVKVITSNPKKDSRNPKEDWRVALGCERVGGTFNQAVLHSPIQYLHCSSIPCMLCRWSLEEPLTMHVLSRKNVLRLDGAFPMQGKLSLHYIRH